MLSEQLTVSLSKEQLDWVERSSELHGVSKAALIRCLINFAINQEVV